MDADRWAETHDLDPSDLEPIPEQPSRLRLRRRAVPTETRICPRCGTLTDSAEHCGAPTSELRFQDSIDRRYLCPSCFTVVTAMRQFHCAGHRVLAIQRVRGKHVVPDWSGYLETMRDAALG
jgi:hypothetical protein